MGLCKKSYVSLLPLTFLFTILGLGANIYYAFFCIDFATLTATERAAISSNIKNGGTIVFLFCFLATFLVLAAALLFYQHAIATKQEMNIGRALSLAKANRRLCEIFRLDVAMDHARGTDFFSSSNCGILHVWSSRSSFSRCAIFSDCIAIAIPTFYITVRLLFGYYALILRDLGVSQAIQRSRELTSGYWWRTAIFILYYHLSWSV